SSNPRSTTEREARCNYFHLPTDDQSARHTCTKGAPRWWPAGDLEASVVLTLAKLGSGVVEYLERMVARGVEEYYVNAKEARGQWLGHSASRLGLGGMVDGDEFNRVLSHGHPVDGMRLTEGKSVPRVVGFDATFGAPKSVSLLFALGPRDASNEVRNAHD